MQKRPDMFFTLLILTILTAFFADSIHAQPDLVFKMNHQFPPETPGSKIDQWFADQIETKTKGRVKIRIFWSNGLAGPKENLNLLSRGAIDLAGMSAGYFPEELPLLAAPNSIPMALDNVCQSSLLMKTFLTNIPEISKESEAVGIRPLFFHVLNPYLLVTKEPITRFSQLKGMRIRTWGKDMAELVKAAGGTPVPLFLPDLYRTLETGVIDGCPFSVDLVISYRIHEIAKHITNVILWEGPSWGVWISTMAWEKLLQDEKQIFIQTAEQARQKTVLQSIDAEKKSIKKLMKHGVSFHPFTERELNKWKNNCPDFFSQFIERMDRIGNEDAARKMVSFWREIRLNKACPSARSN